MRIQLFQIIFRAVCAILLVAGLLAPAPVLARDQEVCWGGGFDPKARPSCRFLAYIFKPKGEVRVRVDSYETFENVATLRLIPLQGGELVSKTCWKASRHVYAPWECSFSTIAVSKLSGLGMIIAENKYGQNLLTDDIDFDAIRTLFNSEDSPGLTSYPSGQ